MITVDCEQLSTEWFAARCGVPSASCFDKIVTSTGAPSKQRTKYMYQLAGEKILGFKEESYTNAAMQRGVELEPEARSLYEFMHDVTVETPGLCYKDEKKLFSCSPDGLTEGGLEIKCPTLPVHVEYLLGNKLPTTYKQQVQGSLYVTGLPWWDFMSYYPGMKPLIIRVERDVAFLGKLAKELTSFCEELEETYNRLKESC